ncbi:hypothetical protein Tco_1278818, partial [Tanacetum coccineum]
NSLPLIKEIKGKLHIEFMGELRQKHLYLRRRLCHPTLKDLGQLSYYLGIEFIRSSKGIVMTQRKYALDLI